jgi:hypothetical protein
VADNKNPSSTPSYTPKRPPIFETPIIITKPGSSDKNSGGKKGGK